MIPYRIKSRIIFIKFIRTTIYRYDYKQRKLLYIYIQFVQNQLSVNILNGMIRNETIILLFFIQERTTFMIYKLQLSIAPLVLNYENSVFN